jgi:hypothetical protein
MKNLLVIFGIIMLSLNLSAQKYSSKNGFTGFYSHTPVEDVKGDNNQVASIFDASTGDIVFQILNKSFHFDRTLMEEHFNENYMESEKFPKSTFKGKIINLSEVNFAKPGVYSVTVTGEMNMHGVANPFSTVGTLEVVADGIVAKSKFTIKPDDYGIIIPGLVREKIAKEMEVMVNIKYSALTK